MSSEGENTKNSSSETDKKENDLNTDGKVPDEKEAKVEKEAEEKKNDDKPASDDAKPEKSPPAEDKVDNQNNDIKNDKGKEKDKQKDEEPEKAKEEKVEKKAKSENNDTEEGEGTDKEESEADDESVPLLDQPLEQTGTRERKKVQRYNEDLPLEAKEGKTEIPNGSGLQLGEIPRIDASISRFKNDDLKLLHRFLFKTPGKTAVIKKNIRRFNGFDFKKDSDEYAKKLSAAQKFELKQLKSICEMLDLEKKGNKEEISERILEFLMEPKDSGKTVGGGRPKRTAAVKANNRGYSSHDDSYSSDERHATRARRDKGKRSNLKDDSSSGSDEEFHPSDEEERPRVTTRGKRPRKKALSEDEASDVEESATTEESDEEPKKKKRGSVKVVNNKNKGKVAPKTRGRKPAPKKNTPTKRGRKRDNDSSEEESDHAEQEDGSSSEDEPLAKKKAAQPPTDEEIKTYVKEILDGANLEEITMKTVCKQVYAHYPDFDLAHKKDFIKSTVKSLIST